MNPLLIISIPLALMTIGMILNSFRLSFDQPASSPEQDPSKRMAAEKQAYRDLFDFQRSRSLKRQKRVGQCAWLVLAAFVVSSGWLYFDTVNKTTASKQVVAIQTLPVVESKDIVLSLTLGDGDNVQYLIKPPVLNLAVSDGAATQYVKLSTAEPSGATAKDGFSKEAVQNWRLTSLGTALSIGAVEMPLGIALQISK
ncbi:MAG: hypothetical protein A3F90_09525 [Deltaproteobacteria bacterium RIFCSPLOWO2_12_FULL_60_19]|nr:MAG: hypothetical protein A3F90_09525 [Deltaproteobacteria bacterium RIFCSPLOWO2_12_FULL_60_19]